MAGSAPALTSGIFTFVFRAALLASPGEGMACEEILPDCCMPVQRLCF
jgi:hypothetical protein